MTSVESDGTPRDFYETAVTIVDPELGQQVVQLDQVAPGVYEAPTRARSSPAPTPCACPEARRRDADLGRTLVLVAPDPGRVPAAGRQRAAARRRCAPRPAGGPSRRPPRSGRTTCARPPSPPTSGRCCSSWRCSCSRSTSPSDASRSRAASWPPARAWFSYAGAGARARGPTGGRRRDAGRQGARRRIAIACRAGQAADGPRCSATDGTGGGADADERATGGRRRHRLRRPISRASRRPGGPRRAEAAEPDTLARLREAKKRAQR